MSSTPTSQFPDRPVGRLERRAVTLSGLIARQDGSTAAVQLTDLSYDGCGLETEPKLEIGERIQLSVLGRGALAATVCWCSDGRAGLTFEATPSERTPVPRRGKRVAVAAEVTMRRAGNPNFRVRVLDLSPSGCSVEIVDRPDIGELVWIKVDGLEALEATVCWVADHKAGLRYANAIHPAVFDLLLTKLGHGSGG